MITKPISDINNGKVYRVGYAIYGLLIPLAEVRSIYDLMNIQVTATQLKEIAEYKFPGPDELMAYQINADNHLSALLNPTHEIVQYLPELIDLKTLSPQILGIFLDECIAEQNAREGWEEWPCWNDDDEFQSMQNEHDKAEATIKELKRLLNSKIGGYVYLIKSASGYWKIGKTINPDDRMKTFSVKLPFEVEYEHIIPCQNHHMAEDSLHLKYATKRVNGEWFNLEDWEVEDIKRIRFM